MTAPTPRDHMFALIARVANGGDTVPWCDEARRLLDEVEAAALTKRVETSEPTPLSVRWDRTVIHPQADPTDDTIVCCIADGTGRLVALFLDDEHREALGSMLVDPNPEDDGDWVFCSHRACRNGERRVKAAERGWHQGPMDAWLCTTHAPGGDR